MRIYFSCLGHGSQKIGSQVERFYDLFEDCQIVLAVPQHEGEHFDTLYECGGIVVWPNHFFLAPYQLWEVKMMLAVHKMVYALDPDDDLIKIDCLEDVGIHFNSRVNYEKVK